MSYQPYQPQPYQRPPYQRPRRRHPVLVVMLIAAGVLAAVIAAVAAAEFGRRQAASAPPAAGIPAAPATAAGMGTVVLDGSFGFDVWSVSCGARAAAAVSAGGIGEAVPAGAVECIVTMTVTDSKGGAQTFFDANQYAYDAAGRQFSADTAGGVYLKGDQDATQVNPGITITARVPFQIPRGDRIVRLVLHDSAFSDGVTVRL